MSQQETRLFWNLQFVICKNQGSWCKNFEFLALHTSKQRIFMVKTILESYLPLMRSASDKCIVQNSNLLTHCMYESYYICNWPDLQETKNVGPPKISTTINNPILFIFIKIENSKIDNENSRYKNFKAFSEKSMNFIKTHKYFQ